MIGIRLFFLTALKEWKKLMTFCGLIKKHLSYGIELNDVTDDYCVFGLFGPKSRDLIKSVSKDDFDNKNFKDGFFLK